MQTYQELLQISQRNLQCEYIKSLINELITADFSDKEKSTLLVNLYQENAILAYIPKNFLTIDFICEIIIKNKNSSLTIDFIITNTATIFKSDLRYINIYVTIAQHAPKAFYWIPAEYLSHELCQMAVIQNPQVIKYIPSKLLTQELCKLVLTANRTLARFIPAKWLHIEDILFILGNHAKNAKLIAPYILNLNKRIMGKNINESLKIKLALTYKLLSYFNTIDLENIPADFITPFLYRLHVKASAQNIFKIPYTMLTDGLIKIAIKANPMILIEFDLPLKKEWVDLYLYKLSSLAVSRDDINKLSPLIIVAEKLIQKNKLKLKKITQVFEKLPVIHDNLLRNLPENFITSRLCVSALNNSLLFIIDIPDKLFNDSAIINAIAMNNSYNLYEFYKSCAHIKHKIKGRIFEASVEMILVTINTILINNLKEKFDTDTIDFFMLLLNDKILPGITHKELSRVSIDVLLLYLNMSVFKNSNDLTQIKIINDELIQRIDSLPYNQQPITQVIHQTYKNLLYQCIHTIEIIPPQVYTLNFFRETIDILSANSKLTLLKQLNCQQWPAFCVANLNFSLDTEDTTSFINYFAKVTKVLKNQYSELDNTHLYTKIDNLINKNKKEFYNLYKILGKSVFPLLNSLLLKTINKTTRFLDSFRIIKSHEIAIFSKIIRSISGKLRPELPILISLFCYKLEEEELFNLLNKLPDIAFNSFAELETFLLNQCLLAFSIDTGRVKLALLNQQLSLTEISNLLIGIESLETEVYENIIAAIINADLDQNNTFNNFITNTTQQSFIGKSIAFHNLNITNLLNKNGINVIKALNYPFKKTFIYGDQHHAKIYDNLVEIFFNLNLNLADKKISSKLLNKIKKFNIIINDDAKIAKISQTANLNLLKKIISNVKHLQIKIDSSELNILISALDATFLYLTDNPLKNIRKYSVQQWDKNNFSTLFLGDELNCCLATTGIHFEGMIERRLDHACFIHVIINEATQKPVCGSWLFFAINDKDEVNVVANFFEIKDNVSRDKALMDLLIKELYTYTHQFTQRVRAKAFLIRPLDYGNIPDFQQFKTVTTSIKKIGGHLKLNDTQLDYYLDAENLTKFYLCDIPQPNHSPNFFTTKPLLCPTNNLDHANNCVYDQR